MTNTLFHDLTDLTRDQMSPELAHAFLEQAGTHLETRFADPLDADMPEAGAAEAACHLIMATLFDLMRDTRLEPYAERLAWQFVNSAHRVAEQIAIQEDKMSKELRQLIRRNDTSEIGSHDLERQQEVTRSAMEARAAFEAMRDVMAAAFLTETGRPWIPHRGSKVSNSATASYIQARDFLRARTEQTRARMAPQGSLVVVSGGDDWADHQPIYAALDEAHARHADMILATTGQERGVDRIAACWAASHQVTVVPFLPNWKLGKRAGFARNERLAKLEPKEAIVCEGSYLQVHLVSQLRQQGIPTVTLRKMKASIPAPMQPSLPMTPTDSGNAYPDSPF